MLQNKHCFPIEVKIFETLLKLDAFGVRFWDVEMLKYLLKVDAWVPTLAHCPAGGSHLLLHFKHCEDQNKNWKTPGTFAFHFGGCLFGTFPALLGCDYLREVLSSFNFIDILSSLLFLLKSWITCQLCNSKLQKAGLVFEREKLTELLLLLFMRE